MGLARRSCSAFKEGNIEFLNVGLGYVAFKRFDGEKTAIIGINRWKEPEYIPLDIDLSGFKTVFGNPPEDGVLTILGEDIVLLLEE